jgi:hypothetical protein
VFPSMAGAQVVRGVVTDRGTGAPLAGALLTIALESATSDAGTAVLSNARGEYAIRAPAPGSYRLSAKRIGVQRYRSEPFELAAGQTLQFDIALEPVAYALPEVRVAEFDLCVARDRDRQRTMALWDEARTALAAAQVSLRDRLFEGQVRRYSRGLDPRTLRVLGESWSDLQGVMDRPFGSLSGDSLSLLGYRRTIDSTDYYYAPDALVLQSAAFLRDHCFAPVDGGRARRGLVGLTFEPIPGRDVVEVRGTLWLDARSFELRLVEFHFTQVDGLPGSEHIGGEVHFARLDNGAWMTSRWFVRFPQGARLVSPVDAETRSPSVVVRQVEHQLQEEGGTVISSKPRGGTE